MSHFVEGISRGTVIELQADPGFADGQRVSIAFNSPSSPDAGIEAILRTAGAMADDPEYDAIMEEIQRDRGSLIRSPLGSPEATSHPEGPETGRAGRPHAIYEVLSHRHDTGELELAARHDEHRP